MAAKPNCLIVCSSATQGMEKYISVELSVKKCRGIKYLRFPNYLSRIFLRKKREENTESVYVRDACHAVTVTVMFFLIRRLTLRYFFFVLWISGVSAQSFIHAFTLTHSVFNVQIATPQVRKIFNYRGHDFHFIRLFYLTSTPPPLFTEVL